MRRLISLDSYKSYSFASDTKLDANVSVPDYVDAILHTHSTVSNWAENRENFLRLDYSQVATSASANSTISKTSEGIVRSIVDCAKIVADQQGFFVTLLNVSPNRDALNILFRKNSHGDSVWKLRGLRVDPPDASFHCDENYQLASSASPKVMQAAHVVIGCTKNPNMHLTLHVNTDQGPGEGPDHGSFALTSTHEEIGALKDQVTSLQNSLALAVPQNTVVHFNLQQCPNGWGDVEAARGRYIVGLRSDGQLAFTVGEALSNGENRATGEHTHLITGPIYPFLASGTGVATGPGYTTGGVVSRTNGVEGGAKGGTNAPYIQFVTCVKL